MPSNHWQQLTPTQKVFTRTTYFFGFGFFFVMLGLVFFNRKLLLMGDIKTLLT